MPPPSLLLLLYEWRMSFLRHPIHSLVTFFFLNNPQVHPPRSLLLRNEWALLPQRYDLVSAAPLAGSTHSHRSGENPPRQPPDPRNLSRGLLLEPRPLRRVCAGMLQSRLRDAFGGDTGESAYVPFDAGGWACADGGEGVSTAACSELV